MQKQTCQNPFSALVSMFITEGVYGCRRQGLDHKQPKHLQCVLHNQFETNAETFRVQLPREGGRGVPFPSLPHSCQYALNFPPLDYRYSEGGGGSISQLSPFLPVCPQFPGLRLRVLREGGGVPCFPCHKFPNFPLSITKCHIGGGHVNVWGSKSWLSGGGANIGGRGGGGRGGLRVMVHKSLKTEFP